MNEKKKLRRLPKHIVSFVLTLVMVITLIPITPVMAESGEVTIDNFKYQLNPTDRTATLTDCAFSCDDSSITEIDISTVEYEGITYTVTAVGEYAVSDPYFNDIYELITSVSLPNVTTIGDYAFHDCFGLTSLNLPKVKQIGVSSFGYCEALSSISLPEVISIAESGFFYNTALTNIDMPKVVTVGNNAFDNCSSLGTLDLPEATSIGEEAFSGCNSLTSVTLPKVTSLSGSAFNMCMSLETISMPEVIDVGEAAFGACFNITEVSFPKLKNLGDVAFDSSSGITSISLPSLLTIQDCSLMGIEDASLTLPDTWPEDDRPVWDSDEEKFLWKEGKFNEVNYAHVHNWTYAASNEVLTATCSRDASHTATLTLTASDANYSGSAVEATMDKTAWEAAGLTAPTIVYEAKTGSALTDGKAVNAGSYTAKITVEDKTATKDFEITKASQDAPTTGVGYTINYTDETITAGTDYEVSKSNTSFVAPTDGKVVPGNTYYVRKKGNDNYNPSSWTSITVEARPTAPSGYTAVAPTTVGGANGKITGVTTAMEYSTNNGTSWTAVSGTEITGLSAGKVLLRVKATSSAFASTNVEIALSNKKSDPTPTPTPKPFLFKDVAGGKWYYKAVDFVYQNGIMAGKSTDKFDPEADITRQEFVTILYNYTGKPEVSHRVK